SGEGMGTQVSGLSPDRWIPHCGGRGECGAVQTEGTGVVARAPEQNERTATGCLGALPPGLVGILPTGRGEEADLSTGGLDSPPHSQMLLAALAKCRGPGTASAGAGVAWSNAETRP